MIVDSFFETLDRKSTEIKNSTAFKAFKSKIFKVKELTEVNLEYSQEFKLDFNEPEQLVNEVKEEEHTNLFKDI